MVIMANGSGRTAEMLAIHHFPTDTDDYCREVPHVGVQCCWKQLKLYSVLNVEVYNLNLDAM